MPDLPEPRINWEMFARHGTTKREVAMDETVEENMPMQKEA